MTTASNPVRRGHENYSGDPCGPDSAIKERYLEGRLQRQRGSIREACCSRKQCFRCDLRGCSVFLFCISACSPLCFKRSTPTQSLVITCCLSLLSLFIPPTQCWVITCLAWPFLILAPFSLMVSNYAHLALPYPSCFVCWLNYWHSDKSVDCIYLPW